MKKALILFTALFIGFQGFSQSLNDVSKLLDKGDSKGAKDAIDSYLAKPKNEKDAEGWYYKARVYNQYSHDKTLDPATQKSLKDEAFVAFKMNQALDRNEVRMKLEGYQSFLDLYYGYYDLGAQYYNKKDYANSYDAFKAANNMRNFILNKKYSYDQVKFSTLDTSLVTNLGLTANLKGDESLGMTYYRTLADADVSGKDFEPIYESLVNYYGKKGDSTDMLLILEKGKRFYPENAYFFDTEIRTLSKAGGDKDEIFKKYEKMIASEPNNFAYYYNYGVEMYNALYVGDNKLSNALEIKKRLTEIMSKAISLDTGIDATVLMSNHLFNAAADNLTAVDLISGKTPADQKKKKELNDEAMKLMDQFIPYAVKAVAYFDAQPSLKTSPKATRINLLTNLSDVYSAKGDIRKADEYDKAKMKGL